MAQVHTRAERPGIVRRFSPPCRRHVRGKLGGGTWQQQELLLVYTLTFI